MVYARHELILAIEGIKDNLFVDFFAEYQFKSSVERPDFVCMKIIAFQGDYIYCSRFCGISIDDSIWWHVLKDATHSTDEAIRSNSHKMMDRDATRNVYMVIYVYMTTE